MLYPEAAIAAYFGSQQAGSNVWMYKSINGLTPQTYTDDQKANLEALNMTYYTEVLGNPIVYGSAKTPSGEWIDTMVFISWLKSNIQFQIFQYLLTVPKKAPFTDSTAIVISNLIKNVLKAGVIVGGNTDKFTVSAPNVNKLSSQQRNSRALPNVTFNAELSGAILYAGIEGSVSS